VGIFIFACDTVIGPEGHFSRYPDENNKMAPLSTPDKTMCPFWIESKSECARRNGGIFIPLSYYATLLCTTAQHAHCVHYLQEHLLPRAAADPQLAARRYRG
jgi:hypothetical protein